MNRRHPFSSAASLCLLIVLGASLPHAYATEIFRTLWHGQWVTYVEQGDFAVTDGDIIIGPKDAVREWSRALERGAVQTAESRKALTIDSDGSLWLRGASGVIEVPFTVEVGNATNINAAITEANRALAGVLQWVPRSAQTDYVSFNLAAASSGGACSSSVGRVGGRQLIQGDPECAVSTLVHEMGHAMGLWHVQQDADAGAFVDIKLDRMEPSRRSNSMPRFSTRTFAGYDYGSIMHYVRGEFAAYPDRITLETKPAGMDLAVVSTYSAGDLDGLFRLYGTAPTRTTVNTSPPGLQVMVDGVLTATPAVFDWPIGSVHRVWASADLQLKDGYKFAFGRWSHDAGVTPSTQLTWQVSRGDGLLGSPVSAPSSTLLTANFVRLIDVTSTATVTAGGTMSVTSRVAPWPGSSSLFPQFTIFDLRATPLAGYQNYATFSNATAFNGGIGLRPAVSLLLGGSLAAQTIGESFHNGATLAVDVVGAGIVDGVSLKITAPGATTGNSFGPRLSRTTQGTWKYEMTSPQFMNTSVRHIFDGFTGFDNAATGEVAMPGSGIRAVTINAHRELAPYKQVVPSCAGTVALSDSSTWIRFGASLGVTLTTSTNAIFTGWTGTVSGTAKALSSTVGEAIPEFVATFNTVSEPLRLTSVSPAIVGDDSVAATVIIRGSGFTVGSRVVFAGVVMTPTLVDGNTLSLTISRNQFVDPGRESVYVSNSLSSTCAVASNSLAVDILHTGKTVGVTLTEYYNASLDYYFVTGRASDKAALDGLPAAWIRTGSEIKMFATPNVATLPLERHFFARAARGATRGSHFFTALQNDQVLLTSVNPTNLPLDGKPYLEGVEGYVIPKSATGTCPSGSSPIYRAFKGQPRYVDDANHRFSTSLAQHQDMVNRLGWTDEGVAFCGVQ